MLKTTIYFDVMGSDQGPAPALKSATSFWKSHTHVGFIFFGDKKQINDVLEICDLPSHAFTIHHSSEIIEQTEGILDIRRKKNSSMVLALEEFKKNGSDLDFIITAGNTAAFTAGCYFILKPLPGCKRIGFMVFLPTVKMNNFTLLLDAGANLDNKPEDLQYYALFASTYLNTSFNIQNPRVGLLNVGTEDSKGSELLKKSFTLLKNDPNLNFIGNMESRELLSGEYDIVVADGYAGNMSLKAMEGTFKHFTSVFKQVMTKNIFRRIGALLSLRAIKEVKQIFNYKNYGGSIIAGASKIAIKCHGSSDKQSFDSALRIGYCAVQHELIKNINLKLSFLHEETTSNRKTNKKVSKTSPNSD